MSDNPSSALLGQNRSEQRPSSQRSKAASTSSSRQSNQAENADERTSLLAQDGEERDHRNAPSGEGSPSTAATWLRYIQSRSKSKGNSTGARRWPTIVALSFLTALMLVILGLGFAAPAVVEEYTKEAMVFEPTGLSIDSFTSDGVRARVQGEFTLDGSRVRRKPVRDLGRAGTWIAAAVESKETTLEVRLPEYDNLLLGTAVIPPIVVSVRDGEVTHLDFVTELHAGDYVGIKRMAMDWIEGRIGSLSVQGVADVPLKSGIFGLGVKKLAETFVFSESDIPVLPVFNISKLNFHETDINGQKAMEADASLNVSNDFPVSFTVPPLGFEILVQDCDPKQPFIHFADAKTEKIEVRPEEDVQVEVTGLVESLPDTATRACPQTQKSPLDALVGDYIHGDETTVYVRGSKSPPDTPEWIGDLITSITVPVPFPGKTFGNLIRNFSLADVHFGLPSPFADPKSPESHPRISATVKAIVGLPQEMNFPISVGRVRATSDVYYHDKKLGNLDLSKWQKANSTQIEAHGDIPAGLAVDSIVKEAPLNITDDNVFSDVVEALLFGNKPVVLGVKAAVDVETETALGKFVVREVPAEGKVFVKPLSDPHNNLAAFRPHISSLRISSTTPTTLTLSALLNFSNPTPYSATIPYVNLHFLTANSSLLGSATATNLTILPGNNTNLPLTALYSPASPPLARDLLSQYLSGYNTSLTLRTHAGTLPNYPNLGLALSNLTVEIPAPRLPTPSNPSHPSPPNHNHNSPLPSSDPDSRPPKFIDDATFHILTSTATFTLLSPLTATTLSLTYLNATAYYNHTAPVGNILTSDPFDIPPGASTSPALPVAWELDGAGFAAFREALGGRLRLDAWAEVEVGVGEWGSGRLWFRGGGIGAGVRL